MDKGCDFPDIRKVIEEYDYTVHKMSHVEENMEGKKY